ncbi:MAG: SRPBCC family protein [Pseudonocardia sp.]|mgnify:FL=1|uniref:SRPBCC family protein n=1 Tax=Pseudonocardia sp. TaxID=60912 RepID=UPI001AD13AB9|nr:SRPBCC family protein [Pseudonocardia sp.]MBN9097086.1 SRPBCC family protein [Pseudonocardia sp.]
MNEAVVTIDATPERVWELVTDITKMGEWSPENTGGRWISGTGPAVGARFIGFNAHGWLRWPTRCRVVECERPSRFAFTVAESAMTWGWRLEPDDAGTRLTQWREHTSTPNIAVKALVASGILGKDRETLMVDGMHRTLARLKAHAESTRV